MLSKIAYTPFGASALCALGASHFTRRCRVAEEQSSSARWNASIPTRSASIITLAPASISRHGVSISSLQTGQSSTYNGRKLRVLRDDEIDTVAKSVEDLELLRAVCKSGEVTCENDVLYPYLT